MATSNTIVSRSGTGWTVDVSANNLDPTTSLKDFIVLHGGVVANVGDYTKTTSTILTYGGASLGVTTIEVRRSTPVAQYQVLTGFPARLSSSLWNKEIDRITRRAEEYALNGVGTQAVTTVALPKDDAFGVVWDGDVIYPPTRNSVYDYLNLMAPKADPVFTGNPTAPTVAYTDNDTTLATTKFVKDVLTNSPSLTSPVLSGGTVSVPSTTDNSDNICSTKWVNNWRAYRSEVWLTYHRTSNPSSTGTYIQLLASNGLTVTKDRASNWGSDKFTAPRAGTYYFTISASMGRAGTSQDAYYIPAYRLNGGGWLGIGIGGIWNWSGGSVYQAWTLTLAQNDTLEFALYVGAGSGTVTTQEHDAQVYIAEVA